MQWRERKKNAVNDLLCYNFNLFSISVMDVAISQIQQLDNIGSQTNLAFPAFQIL